MNIKKYTITLILLNALATPHIYSKKHLLNVIKEITNPFSYDLGATIIPSKFADAGAIICCHGYGHNNQIGQVIRSYKTTKDHIISFNFPDYNISSNSDHSKAAYGTIQEITPLIYILKQCAVDAELPSINLYGFSAGGAAIINMLALLKCTSLPTEIKKLGITTHHLRIINKALERGIILLDSPLKSIEEMIGKVKNWPGLDHLAKKFNDNNMRPIDTLTNLHNLNLTIILHFEYPDEIIDNRDDALFIKRLKEANKGMTITTSGRGNGHTGFHKQLWQAYAKFY